MLATWARQTYGGRHMPWHKITWERKAACGSSRVDFHPGRTEFHVGEPPDGKFCKLCLPGAESQVCPPELA